MPLRTPAGSLPPVTEELVRALPKTDLHCHLDGSLRPRTVLELADGDGVPLPPGGEAALARAIHMGQVCRSLEEYLQAFEVTLAVLQTEEALRRAARELALDAAAENVRYLEVRFSPVLHTRRGLKLTAIVDAVLDGLRSAGRDAGIRSNVIVCGIRQIDPTTSLRLAELAVAYKNKGVVGYDLAGLEEGHPSRRHQAAFQLILDNNVNVTIHAGEAYGPESIAQAVHACGAHRIGHGVRLRESGDLLNYLNDHRIPLEMCPSSNVQTGSVKDLASHPLRFYFDFGLRVTVNTDNRLVTDTTASKELWLCHAEMGFTLEDLCTLVVQGFKSAFLPFREKQELLQAVNHEIAEVLARFQRPQAVPAGGGP